MIDIKLVGEKFFLVIEKPVQNKSSVTIYSLNEKKDVIKTRIKCETKKYEGEIQKVIMALLI